MSQQVVAMTLGPSDAPRHNHAPDAEYLTHIPLLQQQLAAERPDLLYHYTNAAGLHGIIRSRMAWASNVRYLNDAKEISQAVTVVDNMLMNEASRLKEHIGHVLIEAINSKKRVRLYHTFVFSLSMHGDSLSQWRAYGEGSGFAIGFNPHHLDHMALRQDFYLVPCIYDWSIQYAITRQLLRACIKVFESRLLLNTFNRETGLSEIADTFWRFFTILAPMIKHQTFKEEDEWRLISYPVSILNKQVRHRVAGEKLIPYIPFELIDPDNVDLIKKSKGRRGLGVRVGPSPDSSSAQLAIQSFLYNEFGRGCWHSSSSTPYRSW